MPHSPRLMGIFLLILMEWAPKQTLSCVTLPAALNLGQNQDKSLVFNCTTLSPLHCHHVPASAPPPAPDAEGNTRQLLFKLFWAVHRGKS